MTQNTAAIIHMSRRSYDQFRSEPPKPLHPSQKIQLATADVLAGMIRSPNADIKTVLDYIKREPQKKPAIIRSEDSLLPKTLYFSNATWYLLLTKHTKQGDRVLGEGQFKRAKYAFDLATGIRHVVAVMKTKSATNKKIANREIDNHKFFNHPHIVKLHSSITSSSKTYLILDDCNKGDLHRSLKTGNTFSDGEAFRIALDCAEGLTEIHRQNFIHRDLKIENIFLYESNGETRAKIGDLGLCCKASDTQEKRSLEGSVPILSPERAAACKQCDAAQFPWESDNAFEAFGKATTQQDDIWALGLIFFALFSNGGSNAYPKTLVPQNQASELSRLTQISKITQEQINSCISTQLKRETPEFLKELIPSMLSVEPQKRPSAQQVRERLAQQLPPLPSLA